MSHVFENGFLAKVKGKEGPYFRGCKKGDHIVRLPPKVSAFVKFEITPRLLCCLLDLLVNNYWKAWNSTINLWIYFPGLVKTILLSPRGRSSKYLKLLKENVSGNMILPYWTCFIWKFVMVWFHKFPKLVFHKQPSCPKIYVLNMEESYLNWQLSRKFFYTFRTTVLQNTYSHLC